MEIIVEVEICSGLQYYIEYEYWINGHLWIDAQNFSTLWKKEGGHYKKVHGEW